jgi:hypothetical protein
MIDPKCCRCRRELTEKGGVLLLPPKGTCELVGVEMEADIVPKLHLCVSCTDATVALLDTSVWCDTPDEWTEAIMAAHPAHGSEAHDTYGVAMRMVGNRHSKGELLALVNWLLVRIQAKDGQRP